MLETLKTELLKWENGQFVYTLIGKDGLNNIEDLLNRVKDNGIEGDFVETGVWQGGACIYARAVMNELGLKGKVYACDSFQGLPKPDLNNFPKDAGDEHYKEDYLRVTREQVESNFRTFSLLNGVVFVEGWFKDTMPKLKQEIKAISILRLDGDMYQSTMEVLENLYDLVSIGGFVIIDDYGHIRCRRAVDDFRVSRRIGRRSLPLRVINEEIVYFQKL